MFLFVCFVFASLAADIRTFSVPPPTQQLYKATSTHGYLNRHTLFCYICVCVCVCMCILAQGEVLTFCKDDRRTTESHTISTNPHLGGAFSQQQPAPCPPLFYKLRPHKRGHMTSWDKKERPQQLVSAIWLCIIITWVWPFQLMLLEISFSVVHTASP